MNPPGGFEYIKTFYLSCTDGWPTKTTKEVFQSCIKHDGICTEDEIRPFGSIYISFLEMAKDFLTEYEFPALTTKWDELYGQVFEWTDFSAKALNKQYLLAGCNLLGSTPGDHRGDFFRSNVFLAPLVDSVPMPMDKNDAKHTIYLVPLYIPESILTNDVTTLRLYKELMTGVFTALGVSPDSQMSQDIEKVLELEQALGEITMKESGVRYTEAEAHWTKMDFRKHGGEIALETLQSEMPSVDWTEYLEEAFKENLNFDLLNSKLWIPSMDILKKLETFLKATSKRDQANLLMWRMVYQVAVDFLVAGFENNDEEQMDIFTSLFGKQKSREGHCEAQIMTLFPEVKNDMIIAKYVDSSQKAGVEERFANTVKAYLEVIDEQTWMDTTTKTRTKTKVKAVKLNVGDLSPKGGSYERLKKAITKEDYFQNIFEIGKVDQINI